MARGFFFIPTTLALITSFSIIFYIYSTSSLFIYTSQTLPHVRKSLGYVNNITKTIIHKNETPLFLEFPKRKKFDGVETKLFAPDSSSQSEESLGVSEPLKANSDPGPLLLKKSVAGDNVKTNAVFHDRDIFLENYNQMNKTFKIYVYPHDKTDPFAHALLPVKFEPSGNYASESYFRKALFKSHFITKDPSKADLFFLPFSISRLRHDPRIGVEGIQDFIKDYIFNVSKMYPYWNRTGGADHFYVACHSVGNLAMKKVEKVKLNAIQIVCSSSYFLSGYIAHKDASLPQIWPRQGLQPDLASFKREKLAFFAGSNNSPVRQRLIRAWENDTEIFVHSNRLTTPYDKELLSSKYCLHVKGYEVNTARIGDALYYGCVPVIIANHYDLPFSDILNWRSFSIVVATLDIPMLKKILKGVSDDEYLESFSNVLKVREHFQWHLFPVDYDAFYMVMYELWLRRSFVRIQSSHLVDISR